MLQAEKEREAAIKAAMERAAADYHRETEQLAAQKAETEAKLAEKVRRSRMKARRKEEAVEPAPKVHLLPDFFAPPSNRQSQWIVLAPLKDWKVGGPLSHTLGLL